MAAFKLYRTFEKLHNGDFWPASRVIARNHDEAKHYLSLRGAGENIDYGQSPRSCTKEPSMLWNKIENQRFNFRRHYWPGTIDEAIFVSFFALSLRITTIADLWQPSTGLLAKALATTNRAHDSHSIQVCDAIRAIEERIPGWTLKYAKENEYVAS